MKFEFKNSEGALQGTLIAPVLEGMGVPPRLAREDKEETLARAITAQNFNGCKGEFCTVLLPTGLNVTLVGVGKVEGGVETWLQTVGGSLASVLKKVRQKEVMICTSGLSEVKVKTGTAAAAAGGFTSLLAMPNTSPAADSPASIRLINDIISETAKVRVYQSGCITENRGGERLAPYGSLKKLGVKAITDDGSCVQNNELMRNAMEYAKMFGLFVMDHCQENTLTANGQMHEGEWSVRLGLGGWPSAAEDIIVSRDVILAYYTHSHIHLQHISSALSVDIIRNAKRRGVSVSAEATPHHLSLTDECLKNYDTNFKMCPPLRAQSDVDALIEGVVDGTIEVIATDHAPHTDTEKDREFDRAPFGITGLETAFSVCHGVLVRSGKIKLPKLVKLMSTRPAELLGLDAGTLKPGTPADFVLIDENEEYVYSNPLSRSENSPWLGKKLRARVVQTFLGGKRVYIKK